MSLKQRALEFIEETNREIGVKVVTGVNAYPTQSSPNFFDDEGSLITFDPFGFTDENEETISRFAELKGLKVEETWNDWGRFLIIVEPNNR